MRLRRRDVRALAVRGRPRARRAGRGRGGADPPARVLRVVLGSLERARDPSRCAPRRARAAGPRPRLLHERRLRRDRNRDQARAPRVARAGAARAHRDPQPRQRVPRRRLRLARRDRDPAAQGGFRPTPAGVRPPRDPDGRRGCSDRRARTHDRGDRRRPHRRIRRGARSRRRRDDPAAGRLLEATPGRTAAARDPARRRRGRHRLRTDGPLVRVRALRDRSGRDRDCQGAHERLHPDGRRARRRSSPRAARRNGVPPRVHVQRPPRRRGGRARKPRHHRARTFARPGPRARRVHARPAATARRAARGEGGTRRRDDVRRRARGRRRRADRARRARPRRHRPCNGTEDRPLAAARDRARAARHTCGHPGSGVARAVSQALQADAPVNQSVERAVRLLGFFSPEEPELTLADLTSRLGTSKATTHRYTLALRRVGLLRYDSARAVYTLGPRIVELAAAALAGLRIIKIAGPHMERLVADLNETVVLSIWDREAPVVLRTDDNTERIARIVVRAGSRLPLTTSAQGKVFGAFLPELENRLDSDELQVIRASRIAINSEVVAGIRAVATPVFQDRELLAAMAVVGTAAAIPDDPRSPLARTLRGAAERLSDELGFLPSERSAR